MDLRFWFALFGPEGLPDAVKAKLESVVTNVMADPRVRERLANLDVTPDFAPLRSCGRSLKTRSGRNKFIDENGIKPE